MHNSILLVVLVHVVSTECRIPALGGNKGKIFRVRSGRMFRVTSEHDLLPGEYSYVVRLEMQIKLANETEPRSLPFCTGAVLTPDATLTTGHCCKLSAATEKHVVNNRIYTANGVVRYGSIPGKPANNLIDRFSAVLDCKTPSGLDGPMMTDGVGIALTEPIEIGTYGKISSLDYRSLYGLRVTLMGYGDTRQGKNGDTLSLNQPLQILEGMIAKCEELKAPYPLLCANNACANPLGELLLGDFGGPVVHTSGIVGVNKGRHSHASDHTIVLTQVFIMPLSTHIDWISRIVKYLYYSVS